MWFFESGLKQTMGFIKLMMKREEKRGGELPAHDLGKRTFDFSSREGLAAFPQACWHAKGGPCETWHHLAVGTVAARRITHKSAAFGLHAVPYRATRAAYETDGAPALWQRRSRARLNMDLAQVDAPVGGLKTLY